MEYKTIDKSSTCQVLIVAVKVPMLLRSTDFEVKRPTKHNKRTNCYNWNKIKL